MKKDMFILLFIIEFFVALVMMGLMFSDLGAVIYLIASAVFAVVLSPFFIKLKRETEEAKKQKLRRNILILLFVPTLVALAVVAYVVVALMIYFS